MSTHTINITPPTSTSSPKGVGVQSINVRADKILPGDVVLKPNDGGTVRLVTVVRSVPARNDRVTSVITYKTARNEKCRRDTIFTVLRAV